MNSLTAPSVSAGSGLVNAQALDAQLVSFTSKVNEIVAVVNAAFPDGALPAGSVEWRTVATDARTALQTLAARIGDIRRQFEPKVETIVSDLAGGSFVVPGSSTSLYRLLLRVRSYNKVSAYAPSAGGAPILYADGLTDADLAGVGAWKHSQRIVSFPSAVAAFGVGASHDRATLDVSSPRRLYVLNYISKDGTDIPSQWETPPLDDQLIEVWANGGATITVDAENAVLSVLSVTASPTSGYSPLSVSFNVEVSGGFPPYAYAWDFGDGASGSVKSPSHSYSSLGIYAPSVVVSDSKGNVTSPEAPPVIVVSVQPLSIVSVTDSPTSATTATPVSFGATVVGGVPPYSYLWTFGDGSTSTSAAPTHTFTTPGTYTPSLTVTDSQSTPATDTKSAAAVTVPPAYTVLGFYPFTAETCLNTISGGFLAAMDTSYYNPTYPVWPGGTLFWAPNYGPDGSGALYDATGSPGGRIRSAKVATGTRSLTKFTFGGLIKSTACGPTIAVQSQTADTSGLGIFASGSRIAWDGFVNTGATFGLSGVGVPAPPTTQGRFQHVVMTIDLTTKTWKVYIDGAFYSTGVNGAFETSITDPALRVGVGSGAYAPYSGGFFDNMFLVDGILPDTDIALLAVGYLFDSAGHLVAPPGDPHIANVVSLLHADGTNGATAMTDQKGNAWTSRDSANLTTAKAKFGPSSMDQDGEFKTWYSDDAGAQANFGSEDFTVEGWFWPRAPQSGDYTVRIGIGDFYGATPPTVTLGGHQFTFVQNPGLPTLWATDETGAYAGQLTTTSTRGERITVIAGSRGVRVIRNGTVAFTLTPGANFHIDGVMPTDVVYIYEDGTEPYNRCICGRVGTYGSYYSFRVGFSVGRFMAAGFHSGGLFEIYGTAGVVAPNMWHHFALVRSGTTIKLYCDGILVGSATSVGTLRTDAWPLYVGSYAGRGYGNEVFDGYIDEFRVTRGVARYPADFTPPTAAFPNP